MVPFNSTDCLVYQPEWVTGEHRRAQWILDGNLVFNVDAS